MKTRTAIAAEGVKVRHLCTYPYGGAANAAMRIHFGLRHANVDSAFWYRIDDRESNLAPSLKYLELDSVLASRLPGFVARRLEKRRTRRVHQLFDNHIASRTGHRGEVYSMARLPAPTRLPKAKLPDISGGILHLHWVAHAIDFPSFFSSIPDEVPIIWTQHDMGAFTGGCHYAGDCTRFALGCGNCPQIAQAGTADVSVDSYKARKKSLRGKKIHVVAPCEWMLGLARQSKIWPDDTRFSVLHYGLDMEKFPLADAGAARKVLGLSRAATLVGFGAEDIANPRKGFRYLCDALRDVARAGRLSSGSRKAIELAVFGSGEVPEDIRRLFRVHHFGYINDEARLSGVISACDFVVLPSVEDNQPQVGLEAMACARPVIGFRASGIPEYVRHEETGLLVESSEDSEFASAILRLADSPDLAMKLGRVARKMVETEFNSTLQTRKYLELYRDML